MNAKFDCPYDKEFNMPSSHRQLPIKFNILMNSSWAIYCRFNLSLVFYLIYCQSRTILLKTILLTL